MPSHVLPAAIVATAFAFAPALPALAQATAPLSGQEPPDPIPIPALASTETEKLLALEGETVRVTGRIENAVKSKSGNQFLNFADSKFVAVTFSSDLSKFPGGGPADLFEGKTVAITGPIKIYKGIPEIILNQPSLIEIINPAARVIPEPEPVVAEERKQEPPAPPEPEGSPEPPKPETAAPSKTPPVDWRKYFPQ